MQVIGKKIKSYRSQKSKKKIKRTKKFERIAEGGFKKERFIKEWHRENLTNVMMVLNFDNFTKIWG